MKEIALSNVPILQRRNVPTNYKAKSSEHFYEYELQNFLIKLTWPKVREVGDAPAPEGTGRVFEAEVERKLDLGKARA